MRIKYHKSIYFPIENHDRLKNFNNIINSLDFRFSCHAKQAIKERIYNLEYFYNFIKDLKFNVDDVFEYIIIDYNIEKAVYRIKYNENQDIVFALGKDKMIITLYFNNRADKHYTLNHGEYCKA